MGNFDVGLYCLEGPRLQRIAYRLSRGKMGRVQVAHVLAAPTTVDIPIRQVFTPVGDEWRLDLACGCRGFYDQGGALLRATRCSEHTVVDK